MARVARFLVLLLAPFLIGTGPGDDGRWHAGAYSFSDEAGGFLLRAASGSGTKDDPIVIVEELLSASPVTLVIRATREIRPYTFAGDIANGFVHFRVEIVNGSGLAWTEFEFELQEERDVPSSYGDGLSFDQRKTESGNIGSTTFARHERNFEPYDRLLFQEGYVDPRETAVFDFLVTDFTPQSAFYLVQDPRIPFS